MSGKSKPNYRAGWLFGAVLSLGLAAFLAFLARGTHGSPLMPILFIGVVAVCARLFGLLAGVLGSILATALFALFLFEPYGSLHVSDQVALFNLALLLFAGIALSYANSDPNSEPSTPRGTLKPR